MDFIQLKNEIFKTKSYLCTGLDPDWDKLPPCLKEMNPARALIYFNRAVIDATAPYCVAYKLNLAFYECFGLQGMSAFIDTISYLREFYPEKLIIADAKRGDIGNSSKKYAQTFFELYDVDALTVAPYMGEDSVKPFLGYPDKWVIVLALTSNKGAADFQYLEDEQGYTLYQKVLSVSQDWGTYENMMYVVGATQAEKLQDIRSFVPKHFLLVPGVGAQGGSLQEVAKYGMTEDCGLLVNSSRGIIHAGSDEDFAQAAGLAAQKLQQEMAETLKDKGLI